MHRRSHKMMFWGGLVINTFIIMACIAKFILWDIKYFLASNKTHYIWEADFDMGNYPTPKDTFFTFALVLVFGFIEWFLINLQKSKKVD